MTPTYDPETQTWFLENGCEAKSLAVMSLLPGCANLEGYYPNGVPLDVIRAKMQEQATLLGTHAPKPKCSIPVRPVSEVFDGGITDEWKGGLKPSQIAQPQMPYGNKPKGRTRVYDHEAVLADRRAGFTYREIAEKRGMPNAGAVAGIVAAHNAKRRAIA